MQLYVIETVCAQLPVLKALRNSTKLEKKNANPSERRSVQLTKNKVVEIGRGNIQFTQQKKHLLQRQSSDTWASYTS